MGVPKITTGPAVAMTEKKNLLEVIKCNHDTFIYLFLSVL